MLNAYAELLWDWRGQIITILLTSKLSIAGDDATGEEYAERAAKQEEVDIVLEAYGALLAEWRSGLSGEMTDLTKQLRATITRRTRLVNTGPNRTKRQREEENKDPILDNKPTPERGNTTAEIIRWERYVERIEAKGEGNQKKEPEPIRKLLQQLKDALDRATTPEDKALLDKEMKRLRKLLADTLAVADRLKAELAKLTSAFNTRVEYFKQLQVINDDVQDPDFHARAWKGMQNEIEAREQEEAKVLKDMEKKETHLRYLTSLAANDLEAGDSKEAATCPVCLDADYDKGVLTDCGEWHSAGEVRVAG